MSGGSRVEKLLQFTHPSIIQESVQLLEESAALRKELRKKTAELKEARLLSELSRFKRSVEREGQG